MTTQQLTRFRYDLIILDFLTNANDIVKLKKWITGLHEEGHLLHGETFGNSISINDPLLHGLVSADRSYQRAVDSAAA